MGNPNEMDFGGMTLIVTDVKTGATKPGQAGTSISGVTDPTFTTITLGSTSLGETQLIALLALLA